MKQPELGEKIADLRKQKGLTQEELVEKCNLSVRTLQRIEAGEVTPRSYTIRRIFEALDYEFFNSTNEKFKKSDKDRLEQFFTDTIDLFNLKTNTLKKLLILSTPVILVFMFFGIQATAQHRLHKKMIGTWQVCNNDGTPDTLYSKRGLIIYKTISENSFLNTDILKKQKKVQDVVWGSYSLKKKNIYIEFIEYASPAYRKIIGERNTFKVKIEGDLMFLEGINNNYTSTWKRVKDDTP